MIGLGMYCFFMGSDYYSQAEGRYFGSHVNRLWLWISHSCMCGGLHQQGWSRAQVRAVECRRSAPLNQWNQFGWDAAQVLH